jgi:hypothetical protein
MTHISELVNIADDDSEYIKTENYFSADESSASATENDALESINRMMQKNDLKICPGCSSNCETHITICPACDYSFRNDDENIGILY